MDMEIVFPGGKRVDANYKGFNIKTDQSTFAGGENSAPAPFDYFLVSIGTCAGIYVLSFCQQRNISTEGIKIIQRLIRNEQLKKLKRFLWRFNCRLNFRNNIKLLLFVRLNCVQ